MKNGSPTLSPLFGAPEIARRVKDMAGVINKKYANESLVAICALKGAFVFFSDLARGIANPNLYLDFIRVASYGADTRSSGKINFCQAAEIDVSGKHVLIVDDIVDSGHSMRFMLDYFRAKNPLSVAAAVLVDKDERREADVEIDFRAFRVSTGFLVGYGMDYAERYRQLPDICELRL